MTYDVELAALPERRVIGIAHRGPYTEIGAAFERFAAESQALNLWPEATAFLGLYFDNPMLVPPPEQRALAGIAVRDDLPLPGGWTEARLAPGRFAILHHGGPYSGLAAAWTHLFGWIPQNGLRFADAPACEVYLNAPGQVPDAELRTDICMPVL